MNTGGSMRTRHLTTWAPLVAVALLAGCDLLPPSTPRSASAGSASPCTHCHGGEAGDASGAPPRDAHGARETSAIGVGAHAAHLGAKLSAKVACEACHVVPRAADDGHVDGSSKVSFGVRAYTDLFAGAQWRPADATCTVYCHGATLEGGRARAPVWTKVDGTQAACDACHGAPPPAPHPASSECGTCHDGFTATTVNVAKHVDGEVQVSIAGCSMCHGYPPATRADGSPHATSTSCSMCHAGTVNADGSLVPGGLHRNGKVDTTSYHGGGWTLPANHGLQANRDLAGCKQCHGSDLGGGSVGVSCDACHTAGWRSTCTFCHGDAQRAQSPAAPPQDTQNRMATTERGVGAHQAHLAAGALAGAVACGECHAAVTTLDHVDGIAAVAFGTIATTNGAAPVWNGTTCAASYCHGQFPGGNLANAPTWTRADGTQAACGTCHGIPPATNHTTSTACGTCHDGYTPTSVNVATHVDGKVDAKSPHAAGWADPAQHGFTANRTGLAGCKDCHGADLGGCTTCHAANGSPTWATSCTFCHGNRVTQRASPPVDTQGASARTSTSVGAHDKHVAPAMTAPIACTECHPARTASVVTDAAHIDGDGVAEVTLGTLSRTGGAAATYTRTSATAATCSNVYCHGKFTGGTSATPSWVSTTAMTCSSCHGAPPSTGRHTSVGSHSSRPCGDCHGAGYTATAVDATTHVNGKKEVGNRITSWNATSRTCTSSCHGSQTW
jgi:predicted CxxxxCH...CXXCH cytochrome family protein